MNVSLFFCLDERERPHTHHTRVPAALKSVVGNLAQGGDVMRDRKGRENGVLTIVAFLFSLFPFVLVLGFFLFCRRCVNCVQSGGEKGVATPRKICLSRFDVDRKKQHKV